MIILKTGKIQYTNRTILKLLQNSTEVHLENNGSMQENLE